MPSRVRTVLLGLALAVFPVSAVAAPPATCGTLNAGLQILSRIPTTGSNYPGALKLAIWYPTSAAASAYKYATLGTDLSGQVALNSPVASCGRFPLVVFSHGYTGCGTQSVYITEELARLGYIVVAPDHNDHGCSVDGTPVGLLQINFNFPFSQFGDASTWNDRTALYRNADIDAAVEYMLKTWPDRAAINPDQLAIAGHSFGGYTAFAKIGGWKSWFDSRYKAALLYSPYIQAFQAQQPETISMATVPQLFMTGGAQDKGILPWILGPQPCSGVNSQGCGDPGAFEQSAGLKYYGQLAGAGQEASHYAFTNQLCTNAGRITVETCLQSVPNAKTVVNYTADFLEHILFGNTPQYLWSSGPEWNVYWQTAGEPAGGFQAGKGGAANQIVTFFGERLTSDMAAAADGAPIMPLSLGQTTATLTDSTGVARPANLYYVSPSQINLVIPPGTAAGQATVSMRAGGKPISSGPITIKAASPALFTLAGNVLAGWAQSSKGYLSIWSDSGPRPIDISDGKTYLVAWASGLRGGTSITALVGSARFDGTRLPAPVLAASPAFQGVDQVAIGPLPSALIGTGKVDVVLSVSGQSTNVVQVVVQ